MKKIHPHLLKFQKYDIRYLVSRLPFQVGDLDEGLKYLGFYLKFNDYSKIDWMWLIDKLIDMELQMDLTGRNIGFNQVGARSNLVVLDVISMDPKRNFRKSPKSFFSYLWRGIKDHHVTPQVRWEKIIVPKALGVWGLKKFFLSSKYLATKCSQRFITT